MQKTSWSMVQTSLVSSGNCVTFPISYSSSCCVTQFLIAQRDSLISLISLQHVVIDFTYFLLRILLNQLFIVLKISKVYIIGLPKIWGLENESSRRMIKSCFRLKRWLFSLDLEPKICQDKIAEKIFFFDAIQAVNRGQIVLKENSFHLKSLQDSFKIR